MTSLYPSRRFLYLLAACCSTAILPIFYPLTGTVIAGLANFLLFAATTLDLILTDPITPDPFSFDLPDEMGVGRSKPLTIRLSSGNYMSVRHQMRLFTSSGLETDPANWDRILQPDEPEEFECAIRAVEREQATVGPLQFRHTGLLNLLVFRDEIEEVGKINVIPDVQDIRNNELQIYQIANLLSGLKTQRKRATEGEFDSLTDYTPGMDPRKIDWKASAKHHSLLSRTYRLEQNHHIYLALDTGRLMGTLAEGLSKLDYAMNSALYLAFLALNVGDRVGLIGFDSDVREYVKADKEMTQFDRLLKKANNLKSSDQETNFMRAFRHFAQQQKRRSLLVVFTDFVDRVSASLCMEALTFIQRNHQVLFVACQDIELQESVRREPDNLQDVHRKNEVFRLLSERKKVIREMEQMNILTIDTDVRKITPPLLNQYMDLKQTQRI